MTETATAADYRHTVFLPTTGFPMKAGLAATEPRLLARWNEEGAHAKLRELRTGAARWILHDGPPYANGDMHLGHAMNHILKDFVVRTRSMLGFDSPYIPGWDCHGLPIEWRVEELNREKGIKKGRGRRPHLPPAVPGLCRPLGERPARAAEAPGHLG
jgi:isoleucyl-tRNA synthetase